MTAMNRIALWALPLTIGLCPSTARAEWWSFYGSGKLHYPQPAGLIHPQSHFGYYATQWQQAPGGTPIHPVAAPAAPTLAPPPPPLPAPKKVEAKSVSLKPTDLATASTEPVATKPPIPAARSVASAVKAPSARPSVYRVPE